MQKLFYVKKFRILLVLLCASSVLFAAPRRVRPRHFLDVDFGGGLHTLTYKADKVDKGMGGGGMLKVQYQLMFNESWGLGAGVQFSSYLGSTKWDKFSNSYKRDAEGKDFTHPEAFGGDEQGLFENLNNLEQIANNFNNINLPPLQASSVFQVNEEGIKSNFIDIFKIDENYFIVLLVKIVKKVNIPLKAYFYISLFDFETLEENTKIEFDLLQIEQGTKFRSYICLERENIKINIGIIKSKMPLEEKNYFFHFENKELFLLE